MVNKLFKKDNTIYRVLKTRKNELLIIDCVKKTMPIWVDSGFLSDDVRSDEEIIKEDLGMADISSLNKEQLRIMHNRFASISVILMKYEDETERKFLINEASKLYMVIKQTIRNRLCNYLVYQDIVCLAPKDKRKRELSLDERNFRWALNKYFYNSNKFSLRQAYKYLVREKYLDSSGKLLQNTPKFHQFKYFYYKNRSETNYIISRLGKGEFKRIISP